MEAGDSQVRAGGKSWWQAGCRSRGTVGGQGGRWTTEAGK